MSNPFTDDIRVVTQQGADLFDELSIEYLLMAPPEVFEQIRRWFSSGYACGFGAGQRDVAEGLDKLTTPTLPGQTDSGQPERHTR